MPTTESAAAFDKLVEKRAQLNDISKQLHDALAHRTSISGNTRYRELQAAWDDAFREFESATDEFSAIVKRMHEEAEARRIEESETE
jgi:hypothetical protein